MKFLFIFILTFSFFNSSMAMADKDRRPSAVVIKVEGTGSGTVKRKSRIETPLAIELKMKEGDTLNTDANTTAEIALNDGTIVRIGRNSSYKITEIAKSNGLTTWAFSLLKGSIRALVEKSPDKKTVKFRTNTPVGTMGVRGTEFVVKFDEATKEMSVYTIDGVVFAGKRDCEERKDCATLKAGQMLNISSSGISNKPKSFDAPELVGAKENQFEFADLFAERKIAEKISMGSLEPKDLQKLVKEASDLIQSTQDQMLGRTAQLRESMHKAIADGSYATKIRVAERFEDKVMDEAKPAQAREDERSQGKLQTKKFAFGEAALREFISKNKKTQISLAGLSNKDIDAVVERARRELRENRIAAQNLSQQIALTQDQLLKQKAIDDLYAKAEELGTEVKSTSLTVSTSTKTSTQTSNSESGTCYKIVEECTSTNIQIDPTCSTLMGAFCPMKTSTSCKTVQTNIQVACPTGTVSGSGSSNNDDDDNWSWLKKLFLGIG